MADLFTSMERIPQDRAVELIKAQASKQSADELGEEFRLYQDDKAMWAALVFMKHTHRKPGWESARAAIREALGEEGMEQLTKCWKQAREDGRV